jgi:hypothetical protein
LESKKRDRKPYLNDLFRLTNKMAHQGAGLGFINNKGVRGNAYAKYG